MKSLFKWAEPKTIKAMAEKRKIKLEVNGKANIKMKSIYISGKITGMEAEARELFGAAEREMVLLGYRPVNPFKLNHDHDKDWRSFMKVDIKALCDCDAIYMLTNWRDSRGATIELEIANHLEMDVIHEHRVMAQVIEKNEAQKWVGIKNSKNFNEEADRNCLILFDNGQEMRFQDDWPFAQATHYKPA